jgi:mRNA turnover protein 4
MPKSKRSKVVSLTKVVKKSTREKKESLVESVQQAIEDYSDIYVFDYSQCRSKHLKEARLEFRDDGKFYLTKNKIMSVGLNALKDEKKGIDKVSNDLQGQRGMLFTNKPKKEVLKFFQTFRMKECPKQGFVCTQKVELEEGPLDWFPHTMEQRLSKLGVPVELKNGVIFVRQKYVVCDVGQKLTPEQAKILKHFNYQIAEFHLTPISHWTNGKYEILK